MRSDARAKRQSLIAAARRLIAVHGPDVALSSIAAEAEVGIATLYRHFPTRGDLVYAIAEELWAQAMDTANKCQQVWDADPDAAWTGFVRALAEVRLSALVTQLAVPHVVESLPAHAVRLREQALSVVEAVVAKAKAANLVDDSLTPVRLLTGLAAITRPLPQFPPARLPDERQWLIDTYLRGLRSPTVR